MAGGPYFIPRNVKGEGKILFVFSGKALIYSMIGAGIGYIFYIIFNMIHLWIVGVLIMGFLALLGFIIGTFKVPQIGGLAFTQKTGGEKIDDVILRAVKFKQKGKRIYVFKEEEGEN